jgi:acetyl-CoA carboxylase biotin carboxyl carrier protein
VSEEIDIAINPRQDSLPLEEVERLVELLLGSGIGEIHVRRGETEVTVKARQEPVAPSALAVPSETAATVNGEILPEAVEELDGLHAVRSPLVGTFYRAAAPGEEPYVEVGDRVVEGQTLCIVEAMKLMNEIPADVGGEVVEVLAENAGGVQYDEPLFRIRPEG